MTTIDNIILLLLLHLAINTFILMRHVDDIQCETLAKEIKRAVYIWLFGWMLWLFASIEKTMRS